MAFERDAFALCEIEEGDFIMGAGEKNIAVKLININHISVLIGMKFAGVLVCFICWIVSVV
jgi:hypothetical protein